MKRVVLELEGKANGVFDLGHGLIGKFPQPAFQPRFDQSSDTLHVHDGQLMQKWERSNGNFITTATVLGGQWNVDEECTGSFWIVWEMMRTGLVLAASPRSASQISPGLAFIEGIENFLYDRP